MAGTFVLTDTLRPGLRRPLRRRQRERRRPGRRARSLFSDPFGGERPARARSRSRPVDTVAAVDGVRVAEPYVHHVRVRQHQPRARRRRRADRRRAGPADAARELDRRTASSRPTTSPRAAGPRPTTRSRSTSPPPRTATSSVGDTVTVVTQFGQQGVHARRHRAASAPPRAPAGAVSAEFTLAEAQRLAGTDGEIQPGARRRRGRRQPGASSPTAIREALPDDVEVAHRRGGGRRAVLRRAGGLRVLHDHHPGLRRHRPAGRHLRDLQHLLDHRRSSAPASWPCCGPSAPAGARCSLGAGRGASSSASSAPASGSLVGIGSWRHGAPRRLRRRPRAGIVLSGQTVVIALLIGLVVTLVAAIVPAIRATRVPPLAALRDVAIDRSGASKVRIVLGVLDRRCWRRSSSRTIWTGDGTPTTSPPVVIGRAARARRRHHRRPGARRAQRALRRPGRHQGVGHHRTPRGGERRRAARSAPRPPPSALIIGVALVGLLSVFGASAKASIDKEVSRGFDGDFVVQAESMGFGGLGGFSPAVADAGRRHRRRRHGGPAGLRRRSRSPTPTGRRPDELLTAIDPSTLTGVLEPRMVEGEVTDLTDDGMILDVERADDHDVGIGDTDPGRPVGRQRDRRHRRGDHRRREPARLLHHQPRHLHWPTPRRRSTPSSSAPSTRAPTSTR